MGFRPVVAALLCLSACAPAAFAAEMPVKAVRAQPDAEAWAERWYVSVGAIVLQRSRPTSGAIVAANPAGTPFTTGRDFDFGWKAGIDVSAGARLWGRTSIEARYFGVAETEATHQFVTPGNFIGAGFTGPAGSNFAGRYTSNLDSAEVNLRHNFEIFDRLTILAGFRWIEFSDRMAYKINGNVATGVYEYINHLYGAQIGAEFAVMDRSNPFQLNVVGKAGYYKNSAGGGIKEYQGNTFIGSFEGRDNKEKSVVYETAVNASYSFTKNFAVRAGYQVLWLNDVALASDAAARSLLNPSLLRTVGYGRVHYQGATAGATWKF